jgi:hypothetical protein
MRDRAEQGFVQRLIAQPTIEAFDKGILLRLARRNVVPFDLPVLRPAQNCQRRLLVMASDRKSKLQRWFGPCGSAIGARVPKARLQLPRRRACSRSSR